MHLLEPTLGLDNTYLPISGYVVDVCVMYFCLTYSRHISEFPTALFRFGGEKDASCGNVLTGFVMSISQRGRLSDLTWR